MFREQAGAAFILLASVVGVQASPIEYIFEGTATGTYGETLSGTDGQGFPTYSGGTAFSNSAFTVTIFSNSTNITGAGSGFVENTGPGTISIGSFSGAAMLIALSVYDTSNPPNTALANVGFAQSEPAPVFASNEALYNPLFQNYDLGLFGLTSGSSNFIPQTYSTNEGFVTFTSGSMTFEAITPVPEAPTWAMMLMGFCGLAVFTTFVRDRRNVFKALA